MTYISRRRFLDVVPLGMVPDLSSSLQAATRVLSGPPTVCMFSKHLPFLGYQSLAITLKQMGFDGVDLTVRPHGHVLPQNVESDLPRAAELIRREGVSLPMITTGLTSPSDPVAQKTLQTAGQLKIPYYKLGYYSYSDLTTFERTLARVKRSVEGLAAIGRHAGVQGGFHTHSGRTVGSVMWDSWWIQRDIDPMWMGFYFDPCHATIEGGKWGWKIGFYRLAPRINMISLKDFYWEKRDGEWQVRMCPLGEGMVRFTEFFELLASIDFHGPISIHVEYEVEGSTKSERRERTLAAIEKDYLFVKRTVKQVYKVNRATAI